MMFKCALFCIPQSTLDDDFAWNTVNGNIPKTCNIYKIYSAGRLDTARVSPGYGDSKFINYSSSIH